MRTVITGIYVVLYIQILKRSTCKQDCFKANGAKHGTAGGGAPFAGYSIILLKLAEAIMNIATSKMAMAARSSGSCARSPVISRLLTASTM